ncbi:hypothetical protein HaLaN_31483, partial [Haematococcus lacustris]
MIPVRASEDMLQHKLKPDLKKQAEEELPKDHRVHLTKGTFSLVVDDSHYWPYNGKDGEFSKWVIVAGIVPAPMEMGQDGVLHGQMLVVLQWTGPQEKTPDNSAKDASQRASGAKRGSGSNSSRGGRGKVARMTPGRAGNNPSMKVKSLYRRYCDLAQRLDELEVDIGAARDLLEKAKAKQPGLEYYQHENLVHEHERQKLQLQRDMRQLHHEWLDYTT